MGIATQERVLWVIDVGVGHEDEVGVGNVGEVESEGGSSVVERMHAETIEVGLPAGSSRRMMATYQIFWDL